ncbi:MAG: methylated-DNA--[protein]-cysteine S-methyltransferase [Gammaproteobacteria bacterium]|nr:MAG: methylated-DNA--[protein]-cysteine S-methyltransferase [Gammaproteobacteria bacterium]
MYRHVPNYDFVIDSPVGKLGICIHDRQLARLDYLPDARQLQPATTRFGQRVCAELEAYFSDPSCRFTLAVAAAGSSFQQRVWQALLGIAPGNVMTYGELAARLHSGARAVGNACRNNPVSIVVPCHRVVGVAGPGGYSGKTDGPELERKCWLLQHEGVSVKPLKSA